MRSLLYIVTCFVAILLSSLFAACDKFPNLPIAGTSGSSDLGISAEDIVPASKVGQLAQEVGNRLYKFELWRKEELVEKDSKILEQVKDVFEHLKVAAMKNPRYKEVAKDFTWRTNVIQEPTVQAASYSGGGVVVYEGVFPYAETKGGLAGILAHEMVHVLEGHGVERFKKVAAGSSVAVIAAGAASGNLDPGVYGPMAGALGVGYLFGVKEPFGAEDESEADCIGLKLVALAGHDPKEVMNFWENLSAETSGSGDPFDWFSDHRPDKARVEALKVNCKPEATNIFTSLDKSEQRKDSKEELISQTPS